MAEADLILRAKAGDKNAFGQLLELHATQLRFWIHAGRIPIELRSLLSEDDVLQETYVDAFLGFERFHDSGSGSFGAWLQRIAVSNLLDVIRELKAEKRGGRARRLSDANLHESWINLTGIVVAKLGTPSAEAQRQELIKAVKAAVECLPDESRQVITLYDLEQCSGADVAALCGCSPGAMFMRRKRAIEKLAEIMRSWRTD
jgi:RNA polymerase sigma-70 factor (ECF subfamily)